MKWYVFLVIFMASISGMFAQNPMTLLDETEGPFINFMNGSYTWSCQYEGHGDINGDGYDDVIIAGQPLNGPPHSLAFYIYLGSQNFDFDPDYIILHTDFYNFSAAIPSICYGNDLNGDGYDDLIISEYQYGDESSGRVLFYWGGPDFDTEYDLVLYGEDYSTVTTLGMGFGYRLNATGDLNGDGYHDLVVSSLHSDMYSCGQVNVFLGGPEIDTISDWCITGQVLSDFGSKITVGDINGDNFSDLIVKSKYIGRDYILSNGQIINIFLGSTNFDETLDYSDTLISNQKIHFFKAENDLNGDGFSDLVFELPFLGLTVSFGDAEFTFNYQNLIPFNLNSGPICFGSFNNLLHLMYLNDYERRYEFLQYTDNMTFNVEYYIPFTMVNSDVSCNCFLGDVNNDGNGDVLMVESHYSNTEDILNYKIFSTGVTQGNIDDHVNSPVNSLTTYPNPFKDQIQISYEYKDSSPIEISVYNLKGQKVYTFPTNYTSEKQINTKWNGRDNNNHIVSNGIYFIRLEHNGKNQTKKVILMK